jgi:hypothetical protein
MITDYVIQRVFRIEYNKKTATAYTVEKDENQYLITASHVFQGATDVTNINVFRGKKLESIPVQVVFNSCEVGDTIVFKLPYDLAPRHPINMGIDDVIIGTWAYFLGFPLGLSTPGGGLNNDFPFPFIKAALVSAIDFEREGLIKLFLDGHNNQGFSGGPVIWFHPQNPKDIKIIGTVSGFLTENPSHSDTNDNIKEHNTNAGIIEAFWIKNMMEKL